MYMYCISLKFFWLQHAFLTYLLPYKNLKHFNSSCLPFGIYMTLLSCFYILYLNPRGLHFFLLFPTVNIHFNLHISILLLLYSPSCISSLPRGIILTFSWRTRAVSIYFSIGLLEIHFLNFYLSKNLLIYFPVHSFTFQLCLISC